MNPPELPESLPLPTLSTPNFPANSTMRSSMPTRFSAATVECSVKGQNWQYVKNDPVKLGTVKHYIIMNKPKSGKTVFKSGGWCQSNSGINDEARIRDKGSHLTWVSSIFPHFKPNNPNQLPPISLHLTPPGLSRFHAARIPVSDTSPQWNSIRISPLKDCQDWLQKRRSSTWFTKQRKTALWHVNMNSFRNNGSGCHTPLSSWLILDLLECPL